MTQAGQINWHQRLRHSLRWRLVALFIVLALAMSGAFLFGMQKALGTGWRDAARPLLVDYVDRVAAEIGSPPSVDRAQAITQRLPVTVRISGPQVNWRSHTDDDLEHRHRRDRWMDDPPDPGDERLLTRTTADGHRIDFGLSIKPWRDRPRFIGWATLATLLLLTALAYAYVRRLLRPLDDIGAGARRFGTGDFAQPIAVRRRDELGDLATDVNAMAASIHQMLEAKRTLLLAISHELRSPITRARLNTELLNEDGDTGARRSALLRDLQEMASLVNDLLESERLGAGHSALHREPTDPAALAREVVDALAQSHPGAAVQLELADGLPTLNLDRTRMRLLLRNLLDNALRHSAGAPQPPVLRVALQGQGVAFTVRDHGPGVPADALPHLAEPFYRPDTARERATGGVGLGLYLCKLVAQAHGGAFSVRNAEGGGLEVQVLLPV
ncbi:MAG: HAMP domain-containing histidine kinase [Ramlibacter sp.]|jgi:signal transduction histidine kinase|nr:HAMP domain-containing histidine kinase [Ramlibacter sp.]